MPLHSVSTHRTVVHRRKAKPKAKPKSPKPGRLDTLPLELQRHIVDHLDDDSLGRLRVTSRHWSALCTPKLHPAGMTLKEAIRAGRRHVLTRLWKRTCPNSLPLSDCPSDQRTPLMLAAASGNATLLRWMLRRGPRDVSYKDRAGLTALEWAGLLGHRKLFVDALLTLPMPRQVGPETRRPIRLHDAIASGHEALVETLLGPHFTRLMPDAPFVPRSGYALHNALSCGLKPLQCAATHAPDPAGMVRRVSQRDSLCEDVWEDISF